MTQQPTVQDKVLRFLRYEVLQQMRRVLFAVSYTHLDVYKRQDSYPARTSRSLRSQWRSRYPVYPFTGCQILESGKN